MKAIFQPSLLKVILAFLFLVISSYFWRLYVISRISDTFPWGFPLSFYTAWGPCPPGDICSETNILFLILDIVFWYVVGGFLVSRMTSTKAS